MILSHLSRYTALLAIIFTLLCDASAQEWEPVKSLPTRGYTPVFLATTPEGDVVVATWNHNSFETESDLPVIIIRKPLSENPEFLAVCTNRFPAKRGYSGAAVDADGNVYVSADTGSGESSWIRKFTPAGQADTSFGKNGEISDGNRFLGLAILDDHLYTTAAFGELRVYRTTDGGLVGKAPKPSGSVPFIRDIAVDLARRAVFGVAQSAVWIWEGGSPESPADYRPRRLSPDQGKPVSGEGVTFDPWTRKALVPFQEKGELIAIDHAGIGHRSPIATSDATNARVADAVLLSDGMTLLVSDLRLQMIHFMKRSGNLDSVIDTPAASADAAPSAPMDKRLPPDLPPRSIKWVYNYEAARLQALKENKPLLVYFRTSVPRSTEFEEMFLSSSDFIWGASRVVCVWIDASQEKLLAQQLGVFRVPFVGLFDPQGERLAVYSGEIDRQSLSEHLLSLAGR